MASSKPKVAFHTLGCKVNQYETKAIAGMFEEAGYEVVSETDWADVYVINTCTVTAVADKKSRQYIRRMKKVNPESIVAVTGCYAQIKPEEVAEIQGVDIVTGTNEKHTILEYVREHMGGIHVLEYEELTDFMEMKAVSTERTRAYIKVQEGCNRFCSYCVIPYARGPVRSRPHDFIISEAKALIAAGYKEIVLTGINTALYEDGDWDISQLIGAIDELEGDFRIRLSSLEPAVINAEYVKRLVPYRKLCHHLHMSAQSGSDSVLGAMNRPYDREGYMELVNTLKKFDPCYGISTDIIVGFPGERETDFEDSFHLVEECGFCKTHIFKYSKRPMTKAAEMKGQVSPQIKDRRAKMLEISAKRAATNFFAINLEAAKGGRIERVLLEEIVEIAGERYAAGYTGNYIRTYIPVSQTGEEMNRFVSVSLVDFMRDGVMATVI